MSEKLVFITSRIPQIGLELLDKAGIFYRQWPHERKITKEELIENVKECNILLNIGSNQLDEAFFKACPKLELVSLLSVGYDHVNIGAANQYRVPVTNTPGVLSKATADTAFLLMLASSRKALFQYKKILDGKWQKNVPTDILGIELHDRTLGVFGLGRIGLEMAKLCKGAYNMDIIYHNRNRNAEAEEILGAKWVNFEDLLKQSDVLSVHSQLSKETEGLFNYDVFSKMKKTSIFINTSRGAVHNEEDLIRALQDGKIWGAGLDVTNPEPMTADSPLLTMPTVAILPHIGSATVETRDEMARLAVQNIIAKINNEFLLTCINPEVLEIT
ncbi:D-isomer specific 2-hydroxyacid dehydrogenase NAD-binding protein [Pseudopedobacter saltans DSM 12145]|uniref:Glyoxylate/hydroxypyruvate reductase B n=1 Tax=Pseudopedobacter saltans (strain ATCC 51119 / DSM 12145 / JCM 21818 / CCUG 39354 / LMG 10337 / NBRC 100064 / NCIMB 13643) TaxID=762903 RepID=F0S801_PSESL|nr:D-glycerate dehydrogenase [Pseudopedobacter saltans]ADY51222.1 D-isomer specific 2-hydroxyacid dehydrogenase NAD-binding protein [Pseudopedobacter saltans DSM 12145]